LNFCGNCGAAVEQESSPSVEGDSPPKLDSPEVDEARRSRMVDMIRSRPMDEGTRALMLDAVEKGEQRTELETVHPAKTPSIGFGEAVKSAFQNTFIYDARSTRAEYWWFVLFCLLSGVAMRLILAVGNVSDETAEGIVTIFGILLIPSWLSLYVRRIHDLNHSGWLVLLLLIPFINFFLGLYFILAPSQPEENRWRRLH